MSELPDLPPIEPADVSDDDLVLIYDNAAVANKSRKATRAHFLKDMARVNGEANFTVSEIDDLTSDDAKFIDATIFTGLHFDGASSIHAVIAGSLAIDTAGTADGAGETIVKTVTGIFTTDILTIDWMGVLPDGLMWQAWVSADDAVSFRFFNRSGGPIAADTYTAKVLIIGAS